MYVYDIWSQNTRQLLYLPVLYIYIGGGRGSLCFLKSPISSKKHRIGEVVWGFSLRIFVVVVIFFIENCQGKHWFCDSKILVKPGPPTNIMKHMFILSIPTLLSLEDKPSTFQQSVPKGGKNLDLHIY